MCNSLILCKSFGGSIINLCKSLILTVVAIGVVLDSFTCRNKGFVVSPQYPSKRKKEEGAFVDFFYFYF
jgi:hypothetical protein